MAERLQFMLPEFSAASFRLFDPTLQTCMASDILKWEIQEVAEKLSRTVVRGDAHSRQEAALAAGFAAIEKATQATLPFNPFASLNAPRQPDQVRLDLVRDFQTVVKGDSVVDTFPIGISNSGNNRLHLEVPILGSQLDSIVGENSYINLTKRHRTIKLPDAPEWKVGHMIGLVEQAADVMGLNNNEQYRRAYRALEIEYYNAIAKNLDGKNGIPNQDSNMSREERLNIIQQLIEGRGLPEIKLPMRRIYETNKDGIKTTLSLVTNPVTIRPTPQYRNGGVLILPDNSQFEEVNFDLRTTTSDFSLPIDKLVQAREKSHELAASLGL